MFHRVRSLRVGGGGRLGRFAVLLEADPLHLANRRGSRSLLLGGVGDGLQVLRQGQQVLPRGGDVPLGVRAERGEVKLGGFRARRPLGPASHAAELHPNLAQ